MTDKTDLEALLEIPDTDGVPIGEIALPCCDGREVGDVINDAVKLLQSERERADRAEAEVERLRKDMARRYLQDGTFGHYSAVKLWDVDDALVSPLLGQGWRDLKPGAAREKLAAIAALNGESNE
jgi:hypothetical protein